MTPEHIANFSVNVDEHLRLNQTLNWLGAWSVLESWGLITFAFTLSILWTNPLTILITMILLAGAQMRLTILAHDAAHRTLLANIKLNEWVGEWLCAKPVFQSLVGYRRYHIAHHQLAGTVHDPDLVMTQHYPISHKSLGRKLIHDIGGITGLKTYLGLILMHAEQFDYMLNGQMIKTPQVSKNIIGISKALFKNLYAFVITNLIMFATLWACHAPWAYLLWIVATLSPLQLLLRIRQIGDHAVVSDAFSKNPLLHLRSTDAAWWEKMLIAPHHEFHHLEHHLLPTAPSWNLLQLCKILVAADALPAASYSRGGDNRGIDASSLAKIAQPTSRTTPS